MRLSNVYGPRDGHKSDHVIPMFMDHIMKNKVPVISGDGNQARDFVYVKDVADAVSLALKNKGSEKVFNIGTEKLVSVNDLFKKIKELLGSDIKAGYKDNNKGEVNKICLSIKKAKKELGWGPKTGLSQGLKETIKWFKER